MGQKPIVKIPYYNIAGIIYDLEYAAFNLLDGGKCTDLRDGIEESTDPGESLLIAIRNLKMFLK